MVNVNDITKRQQLMYMYMYIQIKVSSVLLYVLDLRVKAWS